VVSTDAAVLALACDCCWPRVPLIDHSHRPVRIDYQYDPPKRARPTVGPDFY